MPFLEGEYYVGYKLKYFNNYSNRCYPLYFAYFLLELQVEWSLKF